MLFYLVKRSIWVCVLPARQMWQMCFPIDKLLRALLWRETPADILLMASETMARFLFIFFFCRAPSIAWVTRLSSRCTDNGFLTWELLVKYVATPQSPSNAGTHYKIMCTDKHTTGASAHMYTQIHTRTNTRTHTNLICPWIKSHPLVFQTVKEGERVVLGEMYTGKVITISSSFGVTPHFSPTPHHFEGKRDFNHFIAATLALVNCWQPNLSRSVEWLHAAKGLISFSLQLLTPFKWTDIMFGSSL